LANNLNEGNINILITIPCLLNFGTEIQTINLIKVLVGMNYKVTVACYYEYDQTVVDIIEGEGASVVLFTPKYRSARKKGIVQLYFLFNNFLRLKKKLQPKVTHVQYLAPGTSTIIILKILRFKNIISTIHLPSEVYGKFAWVPRFVAKYITKLFICVSLSNEESYFGTSHLYYSGDSIEDYKHLTIHNCLRFSPGIQSLKLNRDINAVLTIGFIGRIAYQKGLDILLDALPNIRDAIGPVKLVIAGSGPLEQQLRLKCKELKISNIVEWLGYIDNENLQSFYENIDVLVMPSRFEGFGLTAIEAMYFSKPVIAANIIGLNEVVTNETGGFFKPENKDSLSATVIALLSDKVMILEKGEKAKQRVDKMFSFSLFKENIYGIYTQLLTQS
jgi:glycosyltransferase involved in cell wall biosynthesis